MCRSIKILRTPYAVGVTAEDMRAAALQYVQTVSGFRLPPAGSEDAFDRAVTAITSATADLLAVFEGAAEGAPARPPGVALPNTVHGAPARHEPAKAAPSLERG